MLFAIVVLNLVLVASASTDYNDYNDGAYDVLVPQKTCETTNVTIGRGNYGMQGTVSFEYIVSNGGNSSNPCNTTVFLQTTGNNRIFVRFSKMRLNCGYNSYVYIEGNTSSTRHTCVSGTNWPAVYSVANFIKISYELEPNYSNYNEVVKFHYNVFHDGDCTTCYDDDDDDDSHDDDHHDNNEDGDHNKGDLEFRCQNKNCISKSLKCDGYDNCGDWSDESTDACGLSTGVIIAISVTCSLVGLAVIGCIVASCVSHAKKRGSNKTGASAGNGQTAVVPSSQGCVETAAPINSLTSSMPVPPPYTQSGDTAVNEGNVYVGWAGPYDNIAFGTKPPQYDEISINQNQKN